MTSSIVFLFKWCWVLSIFSRALSLLLSVSSPALSSGYVYNRKISMEREIRKLLASKENKENSGFQCLSLRFESIGTLHLIRSWGF